MQAIWVQGYTLLIARAHKNRQLEYERVTPIEACSQGEIIQWTVLKIEHWSCVHLAALTKWLISMQHAHVLLFLILEGNSARFQILRSHMEFGQGALYLEVFLLSWNYCTWQILIWMRAPCSLLLETTLLSTAHPVWAKLLMWWWSSHFKLITKLNSKQNSLFATGVTIILEISGFIALAPHHTIASWRLSVWMRVTAACTNA